MPSADGCPLSQQLEASGGSLAQCAQDEQGRYREDNDQDHAQYGRHGDVGGLAGVGGGGIDHHRGNRPGDERHHAGAEEEEESAAPRKILTDQYAERIRLLAQPGSMIRPHVRSAGGLRQRRCGSQW